MAENYDLPQDDENIASVIGLEIALADEVEFVDVNEPAKTFGNVNFTTGKDFINIYVTSSKSKIDIKPKKRNGNTLGTHLEAADIRIETLEPPTASYNGYKITLFGEFTEAPLFED